MLSNNEFAGVEDMEELRTEARTLRNEYERKRRNKNKEKAREAQERYWLRKALKQREALNNGAPDRQGVESV